MDRMRARVAGAIAAVLWLASLAAASAQNGRPALVVVITIDQLRAEALERNHEQFGAAGFRSFLERGAYFAACNYDYATTFTAPGHATLFTGTYAMNHGINSNEWWDGRSRKRVSSVEDAATKLVGSGATAAATPSMTAGVAAAAVGASPRNLLTDTLGDELKLATGGMARVFAISLKDRSAVLPGGFSANAAYWIDAKSGAWITSSFYMPALPEWVAGFNQAGAAKKYWNREWKDADGKVLRTTTPAAGREPEFYGVIGATPLANEYEFEFARELIRSEKLGTGPATDLLSISLSANDILGHQVGPDSAEARAMMLAMDRQIGEFLGYLGQQFGLAKVWVVLASDHGVAPLTRVATAMRIPAPVMPPGEARDKLNAALARRMNAAKGSYIRWIEWPLVYVAEEAFAGTSEADAERMVGEALKEVGVERSFSKAQLAAGEGNSDPLARMFAHAYSPHGGWYVLAQVPPFTLDRATSTTHGSPYSYDTHVPLAFYGLGFRAGVYRTPCEPADMAPTLASALGINPPAKATGRVLSEAIAAPSNAQEQR